MAVPVCLTINLLKKMWIVFSFQLLWIKLIKTFLYRFLYDHMFSFPWNKCPSVQLFVCLVAVYLICKEIFKLFSRVAVTFYLPIGNPCFDLVSIHSYQHLELLFIFGILTDVQWYLFVNLFCISPMVSYAGHLIVCLLSLYPLQWCLFRSLSIF